MQHIASPIQITKENKKNYMLLFNLWLSVLHLLRCKCYSHFQANTSLQFPLFKTPFVSALNHSQVTTGSKYFIACFLHVLNLDFFPNQLPSNTLKTVLKCLTFSSIVLNYVLHLHTLSSNFYSCSAKVKANLKPNAIRDQHVLYHNQPILQSKTSYTLSS